MRGVGVLTAGSIQPSETVQLSTGPHLAAGGAAVARARDGRVVFVQGAAPEEDVLAELVRERGRHAEARVVRVLSPGPARVDANCPEYGVCGGCALQHIDSAAQTEAKAQLLRDALERVGRFDLGTVTVEEPWAADGFRYRTRARLAIAADGRLGYRQVKSRTVVGVRACPILHPALESVRATLSTLIAELEPSKRSAGAEVWLVTNAEEVAVRLPAGLSELRHQRARFSVPVVFGSRARLNVSDGLGPSWLAPAVFAQANREGNKALVGAVAALVKEVDARRVLELYAGSGNLTRGFCDEAEVWALEGNRASSRLGQDALPEVHYEVGPVEVTAARHVEEGAQFDVVVVDPPRAGLSRPLVELLSKLAVERIVYVSCDAATFARDASRLAELGYALERVRLFDLYPQTAHLEVLGVLRCRPKSV